MKFIYLLALVGFVCVTASPVPYQELSDKVEIDLHDVRFLDLNAIIKALIKQLGNVAADQIQKLLQDKLGINIPVEVISGIISGIIGKREAELAVRQETAIGQVLQELLQKYIDILKSLVSQGQEKYEQILAKAQELLVELQNHAVGVISKVKAFLVEVMQILGVGSKRALEHHLENEIERRSLEIRQETAIGEILKNLLQEYIDILKTLVAHGQNKYNQILVKAQELMEELKNHAVGVVSKVKAFLVEVMQILGIGSRQALDQHIEYSLQRNVVETAVGEVLQELLQKYIDLLKSLVAQGQEKYDQILAKAQTLMEELKNHAVGAITKVKQFLVDVMEILGIPTSKRAVDEQIAAHLIARQISTAVGEVLQELLQKYIDILKHLVAQGQEKYDQILVKAQALLVELQNHAVGALDKVKAFLLEVMQILGVSSDQEAKRMADQMIEHFSHEVATRAAQRLEERGLGDLIDSLKGTLNDLLNQLKGHYQDLKDWLQNWVADTINQTKPHAENIKILAQKFLEHIGDASDKVKEEALKFFEAHKKDLGILWEQIKAAIGDIGTGNVQY